MQIDWFTAIAQVINFLILLWLLKYFLFNPIVDAMDRREARIAGQLDEAQQKQRQADDKQEEFEQKSRELEQRRNKVLSEAREEAQQQKKEMLDRARKEVDEQRANWIRSLDREREEFLNQLKRRGASQVIGVAERVLEDLAGTRLLTAMSDRFVERLEELPDDQWSQLTEAVEKSGEAAIVSSHEIPDKTRQRIERILTDHIDTQIQIDYRVDEDMFCGLAVQADGYQLAWSSGDYLDDLRTHLGELLQQRARQSEEKQDAKEPVRRESSKDESEQTAGREES